MSLISLLLIPPKARFAKQVEERLRVSDDFICGTLGGPGLAGWLAPPWEWLPQGLIQQHSMIRPGEE